MTGRESLERSLIRLETEKQKRRRLSVDLGCWGRLDLSMMGRLSRKAATRGD